jgi:F-type H+-transporting ATPase subunit epsilon
MADKLQLEIVTPQRAAYSGAVSEITLPGDFGEMGILPGHRALMTLVPGGEITAHGSEGVRHFAIDGGFAEILPDKVTILVRTCEGADEVDVEHARENLKRLESEEISPETLSASDLRDRAAELARTRARVAIVERATRR